MPSVRVSCNVLIDTLYSNLESSAAVGEHLTGRGKGGGEEGREEGKKEGREEKEGGRVG